ncbi:selenium-dependent molybdenum cofactor biosynthesis protein YqeB [Cloacibacillus evryensis]|uniref:Selenium-dependent molybdenum cofactor biosynthesis protein YqeB n=1 Tax=Cloacibacillus evryensis TaxID=508460 RepID=A0AAW5K6Z2_9BACT|nr:selenium-dependent molybdenum cofactor biosynthesis protein YqeB [Cloacibacillus evryensis]EHL70088.1 YqeB family selenium-dependent molybdenum hydroxylase system protein [Synergistes sp. 3_1_syn1]MCQ4814909.1 selenium-dependent molybdenum cofactor biosynthesis protein YqeB [Cloacibacillus evryensis]
MRNGKTAVVRGGGDLATGIIYRLWRVGYSVLALETALPLVVRRTVSVASAVFDGRAKVEDMSAVLIGSMKEYDPASDVIQVLVDPEGRSIREVKPDILVDAVMAKKNIGTTKDMAPTVIAVGPGFSAPGDVDAVIETKRGHTLGRVIRYGSAIPNTGVPGIIKGYGTERLLRAPTDGYLLPVRKIGDEVSVGEVVGYVGGVEVCARVDGVLRGLIHPRVRVTNGLKIGDVDPRGDPSHCWSITDKALAIAGGVLEVIMSRDSNGK